MGVGSWGWEMGYDRVMDGWIWLLVLGALGLAALLYFVVLPHAEGPSLEEQVPDQKAWLVVCPNCGRWQPLVPFSSEEGDRSRPGPEFTNWYRCPHCRHKWAERHRL